MLNASIFRFIILNSVKKCILDFHVTAATDTCKEDVVESYPRNTLKENYGSISLTIIALNLANKGLSFLLYCHIYRTLCDISNSIQFLPQQQQSPRGVFKNFAESTGKHLSRSLFFHKDLRSGALLKIRYSHASGFL